MCYYVLILGVKLTSSNRAKLELLNLACTMKWIKHNKSLFGEKVDDSISILKQSMMTWY